MKKGKLYIMMIKSISLKRKHLALLSLVVAFEAMAGYFNPADITSDGTCGTNQNTGPTDIPVCTRVTCPQDEHCISGYTYQACNDTSFTASCTKSVGTPAYVDCGPYGWCWVCQSYQVVAPVPGTACQKVTGVLTWPQG